MWLCWSLENKQVWLDMKESDKQQSSGVGMGVDHSDTQAQLSLTSLTLCDLNQRAEVGSAADKSSSLAQCKLSRKRSNIVCVKRKSMKMSYFLRLKNHFIYTYISVLSNSELQSISALIMPSKKCMHLAKSVLFTNHSP